jgi:hypothetical protein
MERSTTIFPLFSTLIKQAAAVFWTPVTVFPLAVIIQQKGTLSTLNAPPVRRNIPNRTPAIWTISALFLNVPNSSCVRHTECVNGALRYFVTPVTTLFRCHPVFVPVVLHWLSEQRCAPITVGNFERAGLRIRSGIGLLHLPRCTVCTTLQQYSSAN